MTIEQMIAEMQARILKLEKKVYELPPSIYNPFLESMPNPITHLHTHDPNKVAAWKNVPDDMLEDIPDINKVMADAGLKPLIRDWEVLEFRATGNDPVLTEPYFLSKSGMYWQDEDKKQWTLDQMLNDDIGSVKQGGYYIHSVRRTTDGQVFTVGDKERRGVINRFFIRDGAMFAAGDDWDTLLRTLVKQVTHTTADGIIVKEGDTVYEYSNSVIMKTQFAVGKTYSGPLYSSREAAMKANQPPIYTSADGVGIYEGDTVYFWFSGCAEIDEDTAHALDNPGNHFSSRAAAETAYKNHIGEQRLLSLHDVLECLGDVEKLEEIVKTRI